MNKIKHSGIVDSVEDGCVHVRILQSSACSACKVASHCNASETKEKLIDVSGVQAAVYQPGDLVTVVADASVVLRASVLGYLLPLAFMLITLVVVLTITRSEGAAALSALGVLIPYYLVLYLLREKMKTQLSFTIEK